MAGRRGRWALAAAAGMFALLVAGETYWNDEPLEPEDVLFEVLTLALLVGTTVASALLALRVREQGEESRLLREDLEVIRAEGRRWRGEMEAPLREPAAGILRQFEAWGLTAAEQEVGLLPLKGLSHKEIARLRGTSEATVRQQAASVYRKAGLSGRAALSAFFLEDLLAPPPPAG
jgi:DNA-binding CsgD family transcriptional regulator